MIARLRGTVIEVGPSRLIVECGGVGYDVHVPDSVARHLGALETEVVLHTRQIVREDEQSLYGFASQEQRRLFDLLRDVKGCGSRTSLAIIGFLGEAATVTAIGTGDTHTLVKCPGIGARMAERIVVELRDKVTELQISDRIGKAVVAQRGAERPSDELVDALVALGYRRSEAEEAASHARNESDDVKSQLRHALRRLAT